MKRKFTLRQGGNSFAPVLRPPLGLFIFLLFIVSLPVMAQRPAATAVSGRITNEKGEPLAGDEPAQSHASRFETDAAVVYSVLFWKGNRSGASIARVVQQTDIPKLATIIPIVLAASLLVLLTVAVAR